MSQEKNSVMNWMLQNCPHVLEISNISVFGFEELTRQINEEHRDIINDPSNKCLGTDLMRLLLTMEYLLSGEVVLSKELLETMLENISIQPVYKKVYEQTRGKDTGADEIISLAEAGNLLNCDTEREIEEKYGDLINPIKAHDTGQTYYLKTDIEFIRKLEHS